ncbi:MAG: hypothetical protein C4547_12355 [Phycisphaerales bacterium]|nr:MAG: hypothetical protein C4547_12355 [Phycisphaerales bacterium]
MRIAVLTADETRHRYAVNRLRREFNVVAAAYEQTGYSPASAGRDDGLDAWQRAVVRRHFDERTRQEGRFFGHDARRAAASDGLRVMNLSPGMLNSDATLGFLHAAGVDTVIVYGTNLIREPLLSAYAGRIINMHLGLSPYYRGTATNFYPLVNQEPEYVGATIHLIDAGIDSGPIIGHARPVIEPDDVPHTIGCKAILAGLDRLIQAVRDLDAGRMIAVPQWPVPNPRLYLRRHFRPQHVVELYRLIDNGLIPNYVRRAAEAAARVRLVH